MADDERPDARDEQVAQWLEVEPLDELTRRRLVANAMDERDATVAPAPARTSRAWRWVAAAAVVVVVLVAGLALLTARGGNDEPQASRSKVSGVAPKSFDQALAAAPNVGDFGNLDDASNLAALRAALEKSSFASSRAPQAAPEAAASDAGGTTLEGAGKACARGVIGTIVAQGSGTLDGRPVKVLLLEGADGKRAIEAMFQDACEGRHLSGSG